MHLKPTSLPEIQDIVRSTTRLVVRGGGSKPALSSPMPGENCLDMTGVSGMIEYVPSEYTFTAYAGTSITQVAGELAQHGQYLPFDPVLVEHGATLGGTVAANTAGSGRHRYGGVRDFILGVRFIDGSGQLVRSGGKVVKNAAGFDLHKFMVGSLGRYGVIAEVSFKVFPQSPAYHTLQLRYPSLEAALDATFRLSGAPFELSAVDLEPQPDNQCVLLIRVGGFAETLPRRLERLRAFLPEPLGMAVIEADADLWVSANNCTWADRQATLVKVPLSPRQAATLDGELGSARRRYTCAGNIAWVNTHDITKLETALNRLGLAGLRLTGNPGQPIIGTQKGLTLARRVKQVVDPAAVFGAV